MFRQRSSKLYRSAGMGQFAGWWLIAVAAVLISTGAALEGPNICTRQDTYTITVKVSEQKPYTVRENTWCFSFPPRCSKYKVVYRTVYKEQELTKQRPVEECCKGYAETTNGERCIPVCSEDCRHGTCIAPDVCKCESGYGGPLCDFRCPLGKWGRDCEMDCKCQNGATCDPFDGKCMCTRGWTNVYCDQKCLPDRYGQDCAEKCRCRNGGSCHHISGECHCAPGYTGPLCDDFCPMGKHGEECKSECRCQNGGSCNPRTGECYCTPGWTGRVCANRCPNGFWGKNCSQTCDCYNEGGCDHISGECQCKPGFYGNKCLNICPEGTFGLNCTNKCSCENAATCDSVNGTCICGPGWIGKTCTQRACADDLYGFHCEKVCECEKENTALCHPWTGQCSCKMGWDGETCARPCPFYTFGKGCENRCNCKNNAQCSPIDGTCICAAGYRGKDCAELCPANTFGEDCAQKCACKNGASCSPENGRCNCTAGNMTCDHVTGQYVCRPGYLGLTCEHPCPPNRYGLNCANHCHCKNGGECHHVTGVCQCRPGWQGEYCQTPCAEGTYGVNCTQHCKCQNGGKCRSNDGHCRCPPGWTGTRCTEICPEGYYGDHCMEPCECKNDFFMCHPADGCICRHGYTGENCDEQLFSHNIQEKEDGGYGHIVGVVFATIVIIGVLLAAWMYHRRRVADLKSEIAQVQYTAEPVSPPERNQFDNPVYAYQGSSKFDDGTTTLLNNFQFRNNFHKNINTEKAKFGLSTDDEDDCKGAYGLQYDLKNRDADMGNPNLNVYHSIDENDGKKVEHVYDEIKQNNESEYDELNQPRPVSWNIKPHSSLVANGFLPKPRDTPGSSKMIDKDPELGET
ncbi:hypothetical protein PUN28_010860 [Cardiocondyla obscurior]|uniref:Protein draper n=2 Tax=Cardiocondyla obscurior TaxID=286306 RepID=A0AAW2FIH3_9HYME